MVQRLKIKVYDEFQFPFLFHYPHDTKYADIYISFVEWLNLKINGIIPVFKGKPEGFTGETDFYIVKCSRHAYFRVR
jgi:hypothetical protein